MIETYLASNGVLLNQHGGSVSIAATAAECHEARKDFYRHLRDVELGRWRYPENPEYTVRIAPKHARYHDSLGPTICIEHEPTGYVAYYVKSRLPVIQDQTGALVRAGHAYFEANPEPKPWHGARVGDVWVLTVADNETEFEEAFLVGEEVAFENNAYYIERTDPDIIAGKRIYPEDK